MMETPPLFGLIPMPEEANELPEPENGPYFVAAQQGYMMVDRNHYGKYLVNIKEATSLPKASPTMWYDIPKMPDWIIGQAWSFFRAIYKTLHSEAMVDITWSKAKGYRLFVPPQKASGGGVQCERIPEHYKGQMVGTIHSHCMMNAFHSGTDKHDASDHDGLHITIGKVMNDTPDIAIMIAKQGEMWDYKVPDVQEGSKIVMYDHPEWWEGYVKEPDKKPVPAFGSQKPYQSTAWKPQEKPSFMKNEIVVYGKKPETKKYTGLDDIARTGILKNADAIDVLLDIDAEMDAITTLLGQFGIEIDYDYSISPSGLIVPKLPKVGSENEIPAHWRLD